MSHLRMRGGGCCKAGSRDHGCKGRDCQRADGEFSEDSIVHGVVEEEIQKVSDGEKRARFSCRQRVRYDRLCRFLVKSASKIGEITSLEYKYWKRPLAQPFPAPSVEVLSRWCGDELIDRPFVIRDLYDQPFLRDQRLPGRSPASTWLPSCCTLSVSLASAPFGFSVSVPVLSSDWILSVSFPSLPSC